MSDPARARRLAGAIREIVASTLSGQVKDPRLGMVTITDVRMTGDLRDATVYYTVYGDKAARSDSAAALASATGVIRSEVGRQTGVRFTPTLRFVPDEVPPSAEHLDELINAARSADAELRREREGKRPAGDPDPYRVTGEPGGEE